MAPMHACSALSSQAPKPSQGPHKTRECLPLLLILRNRLK
jgi:ribosomal protein S4E